MGRLNIVAGFRSSWWIHTPAVLGIGAMVAICLYRRPWPARAPVHFDLHWNADGWGSPASAIVFPILAGLVLLSEILASALWAGHEEGRKRFNLALIVISAGLGAIVGLHLWYWANLNDLSATGRAPHAWWWLGVCAIILTASTLLLEAFRSPSKAVGADDLPQN